MRSRPAAASRAALLLGVLTLVPAVGGSAQGPGLPGGDDVFQVLTKVSRAAGDAVVGVRATQGKPAGVGERFREVTSAESAGDFALSLMRFSLGAPLYLAQSALETALTPLTGPSSRERVGSGFVISERGFVLTSARVVAGADRIEVRIGDDDPVLGTLVARDETLDVALLTLPPREDGKPYDEVQLGTARDLARGHWALAVAATDGQPRRVGLVAALHRSFGGPFDDYIEIDAPVAPEASGGPLFDGSGRVVGIVTTSASADAPGASTAGYAVPIDAVRVVLEELAAGRDPRRGVLGIETEPLSADQMRRRGLPAQPAVRIAAVEPGSPAARAGLAAGDFLGTVAGHPIRDERDWQLARRDLIVGVPAKLVVWRDDGFLAFDVEPAPQP